MRIWISFDRLETEGVGEDVVTKGWRLLACFEQGEQMDVWRTKKEENFNWLIKVEVSIPREYSQWLLIRRIRTNEHIAYKFRNSSKDLEVQTTGDFTVPQSEFRVREILWSLSHKKQTYKRNRGEVNFSFASLWAIAWNLWLIHSRRRFTIDLKQQGR